MIIQACFDQPLYEVPKMPRMKKLTAIVLAVLFCFCLASCRESNEAKYQRAGKLMAEGRYEEAVRVCEEAGDYEDAGRMAAYGKAVMAAEAGDYPTALSAFSSLGDYKDSPTMVTYYTARQYESQATETNWSPRAIAADTYDRIAFFRDSAERAEQCRRTLYEEAVHLAETEQYGLSIERLKAIPLYEDSTLLRQYYEAFRLEQEDRFSEACAAFLALGEAYRDAADQAEAVQKRGYDKADAYERAGNQEAARLIFEDLGGYGDAAERAGKPYYDLGVSLRNEKRWVDAVNAFLAAGSYGDAEEQVKETRYLQAIDRRGQQNWDGAIEIFTELGDYKDSATVQIDETIYQKADALEKDGDPEAAYELFMSIDRYRDAYARACKPYYDLGVTLREAGELDAAVSAFEHAGKYEDAKEQIREIKDQQAAAEEAAAN